MPSRASADARRIAPFLAGGLIWALWTSLPCMLHAHRVFWGMGALTAPILLGVFLSHVGIKSRLEVVKITLGLCLAALALLITWAHIAGALSGFRPQGDDFVSLFFVVAKLGVLFTFGAFLDGLAKGSLIPLGRGLGKLRCFAAAITCVSTWVLLNHLISRRMAVVESVLIGSFIVGWVIGQDGIAGRKDCAFKMLGLLSTGILSWLFGMAFACLLAAVCTNPLPHTPDLHFLGVSGSLDRILPAMPVFLMRYFIVALLAAALSAKLSKKGLHFFSASGVEVTEGQNGRA